MTDKFMEEVGELDEVGGGRVSGLTRPKMSTCKTILDDLDRNNNAQLIP